jgi:hypothetical protein
MAPVPRDSTDRCRWEGLPPRAHTGEAYRLAHWDEGSMARGVALRCALRAGGREVRVVVRGDYAIPQRVDVYSPPEARTVTQTLVLDNDERSYEHADLLRGEDLNDDGWADLLVKTWSGTAGVTEDVFMWNPRRGRFEQDSVFRRGVNVYAIDGRPCIGEEMDRRRGGEYCWARAGWQKVRTYRLERPLPADPARDIFIRTTEWWDGGRVVRTFVDSMGVDAALSDAELRSSPPDTSRRSRRRRG